MDFVECFRLLAGRLREEIIVTSAGNCSELWWEITRESECVFYLDASMSLASLFAAGIALGNSRTVVALSGDGAFCMNPGMLMVERQMALPNLKHFLIFEPVLRLHERTADAVFRAHRLCGDGARRRHPACLCVCNPGRARPSA